MNCNLFVLFSMRNIVIVFSNKYFIQILKGKNGRLEKEWLAARVGNIGWLYILEG